ncbi:MAG: site-2 protease family protein, partial [Lentisphaeria bacterium]|nr:site-2 protease family protein [Lentisphaeria bacterium]
FLTGLLILVIMYSTVAGFTTPTIAEFYPECELHREDGLQLGDTFYEIDGRRVYQYSDLSMLLSRNTTGLYDLTLKRDGKLVKLEDFPMVKKAYEEDGETVYRYGLYFGFEEKTAGNVLKNAWYTSLDFGRMVWMSLGDLVKGMVSIKDMSGPVGIVSVIAESGEKAETTADAALSIAYLAAFIAVNLAVMNMLPIPALDGGRVFFLLVNGLLQLVLRRKINPKYEGYIHAAGMILLLAFVAIVSFKDIWKLIAGG